LGDRLQNGSSYAIGPLSVCPVCNVGVLWPNGWTDQDETWQAGRPRLWPYCVRCDPGPPPQRGTAPQFSAHVYCGQTAAWIKMPLDMKVGLGPGHIVLDGNPAPPSLKGTHPQFSAHVCCSQTAGWIKMPLGTMVGLCPGNIVLDADPAQSPKEHSPPQILAHVCCGQTAGWIEIPLGTKVDLSEGRIVLHGDLSPPHKRDTAPNFRPMSIVAKRSPISATAGLLFNI